MKRLKLELKDLKILGFEKEYEIGNKFKYKNQNGLNIRISDTRFEMYSDQKNAKGHFNLTAPLDSVSTEIVRQVMRWNADVLYNGPDFICGYCGNVLGDDYYPNGKDINENINYQKVEGACCITKERIGDFTVL